MRSLTKYVFALIVKYFSLKLVIFVGKVTIALNDINVQSIDNRCKYLMTYEAHHSWQECRPWTETVLNIALKFQDDHVRLQPREAIANFGGKLE